MNITRRDALLGATAAAAVTGLTVAPLAIKASGVKAALAGDPVVGLAAQVKAAYRAHVEAHDTYEDIAHDAGHSICADFVTTDATAINGWEFSWSREEVMLAATPGGYSYARITPEERDRALAVIDADQCKVARIRHDLGLDPIKEHKDQARARWRDLEARMLDTPALTVAGVLAKLRGWYGDDEIANMREGGEACDDLDSAFAASVYRDLECLAGEMQL